MSALQASLREYLAARLPDYMVPAAFVVLDALPLLSNGKIDRVALPEPTWTPAGGRAQAAPRTSTEEMLLGIWRELLGIGTIGVDDNFFTLGGHSLLATQVVSRVAEVFGLELPLRVIFERPTVAGLAAHMDDVRRESAGLVAPPIGTVPRGGPLPLSFAQQRLWFLNQIEGTRGAYNMPAALRIDGTVDVPLLERTLVELVRRHESLRTRFTVERGVPMQVVDPTPRLTLALEDLRPLPEDERDAEMHRRAAEEFERPFDLEAGPLVRARLVRLGDAAQVLLITAHHIVSDGWSTGVLVDDLVRIYDAYLHDRPSPLAPLSVQYADFASWQRQWLTGPVLDRQLDYWKRQLDGAPSVSELPTDRPRPAVQTFDGDTCTFALGPALSAGVKRLSERAGATTFMTMLAAFFVLLSRYTRQRDLVVGSPIAGRTRTELEPLVGFFLNTLVLRGDLSGDPTFRELVGRVRHAALDAYAHQDVPFEQIVEALQPERSTSVTPLFQIVFSGSTPDAAPIALPDVRVTPLGPARVFAKFDLTVGMGEKADGITGAFEYNTDLFDRPTMARMAAHYRAIVEAAVTSPDQPISSLPLLSADERRHVVTELNPAPEPAAPGATVPELVAAEAARGPDRPAVADASVRITYVELDRRANALAHRLRALGAGPETRVAVCAERSADLVVSLLGVLKSGAAYVPLDPGYPVDRLRFMLGDSGARVLVASAGVARPGLLAGLDHFAVVGAAGRDEATAPPDGPIDPDSLAYLIYTSGSTGQPKGVEVSHRALMNLVAWHNCAFGVTGSDRATQIASLAFDASVWEAWPYLTAGAELHVADEGTVKSPSALVRWLIDRGITVSFLPTPLAEQALGLDWTGASLRYLLTGGDRLHGWAPPGAPFTLVNNYGPTENTVVATSGTIASDGPDGVPPPIGRAIAGAAIYLVDERLDPVPIGVPGEIVVGGRSLARGYHGRPDLTAERFLPDPFSSEAGARLYRTGDLARWRADGTIDFLGRIDRQVKLRGFRIELGELEAALAEHPDVAQAAAALRVEAGDSALVGYVVSSRDVSSDDLRTYLRQRMPEYMVPAAIVTLDAMPLTGSGKVDYRALPSPARDGARAAAWVAPASDMERRVAAVWAGVLGLDEVGAADNFFDVGGHSLKLVEVHERLQTTLGRAIPIVELFRYPTVAGLAAYLSQASDTREDGVVGAAEARAARQRAALTTKARGARGDRHGDRETSSS